MECLPRKGCQRRLGFLRQKGRLGAESAAIDIIPHKRMADRGQMDPDLMGAAGFEPAEQEARHRLVGAPSFAVF